MKPDQRILTINGGSSSIKFALFTSDDSPKRVLEGQIERVGQPGTKLISGKDEKPIDAADHRQASEQLIEWLGQRVGDLRLFGIGHRVVHGGIHLTDSQIVDDELIAELKRTQPLDLAHLPREIALIEAFGEKFKGLPQIACFDTSFHRDMPRVAKLLPIPRKYDEQGIRRFGFHGISYSYLMQELGRISPREVQGRVILAHLGSGASLAAVKDGKPIDTTMGFTPTAGLVMGTRPGDLDPGMLVYLMRVEKMSPQQMDEMLSHDCGMLGISQTTNDMRDLLNRRSSDVRAAEAIELFCYRARQWIGALAATMGGLDTLVFAGGIGEHSPQARIEICQGLEFIGIQIDRSRNDKNADVISPGDGAVKVRVMRTDEEMMIATTVRGMLMK